MDPSQYLAFSDVDLVASSRRQREELKQAENEFKDPESQNRKQNRSFNLWFSRKSIVSTYLTGKWRSGACYVFFDGRVVLGPRWQAFMVSLSLFLLLACACVRDVTHPLLTEDHSSSVQLVAYLVHILLAANIVLILLTGLTNPGIVPREDGVSPDADPKTIDSTTGYLIPRYLLLNGVGVRQKYCRTCHVYRPPRSNHCTVCDNCVLRHDHHCLALGTCVGLGNYRWFLLLSGCLCLLCPLSFWLAQKRLLSEYILREFELVPFVLENFMLIVVAIASFIGTLAFGLLFMYHYFITSHNLTTNEHLKKYYKVNPFDYGKWVNFQHVLCFPQELLPVPERIEADASYRELASGNSECVSDFYDY